jgi:hypothetical protein
MANLSWLVSFLSLAVVRRLPRRPLAWPGGRGAGVEPGARQEVALRAPGVRPPQRGQGEGRHLLLLHPVHQRLRRDAGGGRGGGGLQYVRGAAAALS